MRIEEYETVRAIMAEPFVNVAGYRFVDLPDRDELRQPFRNKCESLGLLGTILLSHEGINFFLSGKQDAIDGFLDHLERDERFIDIPLKISYSEERAFRKMNVRLKKEIISMGMDEVKPAEFTGPSSLQRSSNSGSTRARMSLFWTPGTITKSVLGHLRTRWTLASAPSGPFLKRWKIQPSTSRSRW